MTASPDTPAPVAILWFRQDLRLADHPALSAAIRDGYAILPVYILDDESPGRWRAGGASRWWLHGSLQHLGQQIKADGGDLSLLRGAADQCLTDLTERLAAKACPVRALFFSRCYEPYAARLEKRLHDKLEPKGIELRRFGGGVLFEPDAIRNQSGKPFRVFTPYYKACLNAPPPGSPLPMPRAVNWATAPVTGERLQSWQLRPSTPDWAGGLRDAWTPGEAAAQDALTRFLQQRVVDYASARDFPAKAGTSHLSPHLHFGEISPRQIWHAVEVWRQAHPRYPTKGAITFIKELIWREFSVHLLHQFPALPTHAYRPEFDHFPWQKNADHLRAWQQGRTGYPIIDAGMRELRHTGYMHNRVRMIVASFLIKDLGMDWRAGEAWFWDTLVDADLANNAASWQWVAGSGADAAPYFRVFNPVLQSKKFDPKGDYLRRWLPELAGLGDREIHEPSAAKPEILRKAGVTLGQTYPHPLVDHATARKQALANYEKIKGLKLVN